MIKCVRYTPVNKSTCLGVATIFVPKWGIELNGITLHQKEGKRWINFPARMQEDGTEKKYYPYFRFKEKTHKEMFCELIKKAIDTYVEEPRVGDIKEEEIPF